MVKRPESKKEVQKDKILEVRMLGIKEVIAYLGVGRNIATKWAKEMGAERRYGRRILYDKKVIDAHLDKMQ